MTDAKDDRLMSRKAKSDSTSDELERNDSAGMTIRRIRGVPVMLDEDLAALYGVQVRTMNQAVKRNAMRLPHDFMFQLSGEEMAVLRSQFVILEHGKGHHRKYLPYAFTEQGVAMLSSVLNSDRAIQVNIHIMRAFVRMRELAVTHTRLDLQFEGVKYMHDCLRCLGKFSC